jgi:hypothetical protein
VAGAGVLALVCCSELDLLLEHAEKPTMAIAARLTVSAFV